MSKHSNHQVITKSYVTKSFDHKAHNQCKISTKCDPIRSNLILLDPIWSNLILFDQKTHKGPLNAGKDEVVPVGEVEEQSLLLSSASASIINNQVHSWSFFIKKQQLSFLFICGVLTSFSVLLSLYLMCSDWSCSLCCCFEVLRKTVEKQVLPAEKRT